jgi:hypothetical protein
MRDVGGRVQCLFSVRHWELSNWSSFFTLLLHLHQLIIGSLFRRIATDWISYFGKCIFNTHLTLDVLGKDFWLACLSKMGFMGTSRVFGVKYMHIELILVALRSKT